MMQDIIKTEKKVEYIELIYDLIFVYVIGRNNSLLHDLSNGFISGSAFVSYVVCTLAVIQIWSFTTYYINIFGRNGIREHISLFVNMFLMYFIAEGTVSDRGNYYVQYHIAWALILINIGLQYLMELYNYKDNIYVLKQIRRMSVPLFAESIAVTAAVFAYKYLNIEISWAAILIGIVTSFLAGRSSNELKIDFPHLTERAMLYVVFTFGEMIIGLSGYFEGVFDLNSLYFSLMGFLIVAALFLSYETLYDNIVDREQENNGLTYMLIHIILIFSLNNITTGLEFMREDNIALLPKMLFIVSSLLLYYFCILLLGRYAKKLCGFNGRSAVIMIIYALAFSGLMLVFRSNMHLNILLTVIYCFTVFFVLYRLARKQKSGK